MLFFRNWFGKKLHPFGDFYQALLALALFMTRSRDLHSQRIRIIEQGSTRRDLPPPVIEMQFHTHLTSLSSPVIGNEYHFLGQESSHFAAIFRHLTRSLASRIRTPSQTPQRALGSG